MRRPTPQTGAPREVSDDLVRSAPLPTERAVLWKPLPDSYHLLASMMRSTEDQALLFITQRAFLQVERHLCSAPELELGGFLGGQLCECPRTHRRYSIVNTVVPFADVGDPIGSRVTPRAFETVQRRLAGHGLSMIGWYRNTSGLGLQLLPDDVETHLAYFNEPWQTTMLIVPNSSRPKGAFFTYDQRVGRGYCIPFYELFDEHAAESNRLARTCVGWTTYVASAAVEPLPIADREIVETIVAPLRSPPPDPEPREPIDEWWDAIKEPWVRLKDVAVSATRREEKEPPVLERARDARPAARPAPPQQRVATVGAPKRPDRARTTRPVAAPPAKQPAPRNSSETTMEDAATPPTRTPYEDAIKRVQRKLAEMESVDARSGAKTKWRRRGRIALVVASLSFLAAIVLATVRARSGQNAQAAVPGAAPVGPETDVSVDEKLPDLAGEATLGATVDSLSDALVHYREIANSHRKGLVSCGVLSRAYRRVIRARTGVESTRRQVGGVLTDADSISLSMIGAEFTHVAQTHQRSGCP